MNIYNLGEQIFLYAKFENDLSKATFINEPTVKIIFIKNGETIEVLNEKMLTNDYISFYYNFILPKDLDLGQYQVIYSGFVNDKANTIFESFYVVNNSEAINPIRLFGYIYDSRTHEYIQDVDINIINVQDNTTYYTVNNLIGQWECYVYPGDYKFIFKRKGYKTQEVFAKVNDVLQEIEFNNVIMEEITDDFKGNGLYEIKEQYILKDGQPIENLSINIYNVNNLNELLVNTKTNDDGEWTAYLDEGLYFLKVFGKVFNRDYDKCFRLKVKNNGTFTFEDISNNKSNENTIFYPNGEGRFKYIDYLYDKDNRPIPDVQVNILNGNDILYQYYTDTEGKFEFNLDEGKYVFEFYHPSFKTINKTIEIKEDYVGEKIEG